MNSRPLAALLVLALAVSAPACSSPAVRPSPSFVPATASACAPTATPAPSASPTVPIQQVETDYQTIPPVNLGKARELKITLPEGMENPKVIAMPSGGALAMGEKIVYFDTSKMKVVSSKLMAARYDSSGNTLWTKEFSELEDGYVASVQSLQDGENFVFTYSVLLLNQRGMPVTRIVFCREKGEIWYQDSRDRTGAYQFVLAADSAYVYAVQDDSTGDPSPLQRIGILVHGLTSGLFWVKSTVEGYVNPVAAILLKNSELVFSAGRQTTSGSFLQSILAVDPLKLNQPPIWEYTPDGQGNRYIADLLETGGGILAHGFGDGRDFILKLDANGRLIWQNALESGQCSVIAMAAYPDGRFVAALNRYQQNDQERGTYLALYDAGGIQQKKFKLPHEIPMNLQVTDDGGLLAVSIQNIKVLPAPAYVSAIWYDTETIVTKYDRDMNVQWRKVYDKYKDSTNRDIAVPMADGTVIVEK